MSNDLNLRPLFPKRAVVTAGMPYGNKNLHFGHIGGVFIHADIFARFLRDRIGGDNVIFVSGTDCYGNTIEVGYQNAKKEGFSGNISEYVRKNHLAQKKTLENYQVSLDLFAGSALDEAAKIHEALSVDIFNKLKENGALKLEETVQFYDENKQMFLNGRQVVGRCPIQGCKSEIAYADECALGHQYNPLELINPISVLSGQKPVHRKVKNWFFDLPAYSDTISCLVDEWQKSILYRRCLIQGINDFLKKPALFVKKDVVQEIETIKNMPEYSILRDEQKSSWPLIFNNLEERDKARKILEDTNIRYRSGKTIVPFRISGNVKWGIPIPDTEETADLTFWVWPESLWAPISFTKAYLGDGITGSNWENWWKSEDSQVFQFIGEDNIYFYGIAEMGLFSALNDGIKMPVVIPNHHLLFGKSKASSSGEKKPPSADELLNFYTPEQLRLHFMNASLSEHSISFEPKAALGKSTEYDNVLYEGNLITNIFNRLIRSCFYTVQKYCEGIYPCGKISQDILEKSNEIVLRYEKLMSEFAFDKIFELLNLYLRDANKEWSTRSKNHNEEDIKQLLRDMFHVVRTAVTLFHPIVPKGCEMIREYLKVDERIWDWKYMFETIDFFIESNHEFKHLEPRVDFFCKHLSQTTIENE